jgi:hypothetical protein
MFGSRLMGDLSFWARQETFMGFGIEEWEYAFGGQPVTIKVYKGRHGLPDDSMPVGEMPFGSVVSYDEELIVK